VFNMIAPLRNVTCLASLAFCLLLGGCTKEDAPDGASGREEAAEESVNLLAGQSASSTEQLAEAHDSAQVPIDCPLRKQGIDPSLMRPFEEVENYIAFLERPDRARWQKPDEVVSALGLTGGETVIDLGAGSGYFAFRLAEALPRGKVIAADIEPEMIRHVHHKDEQGGACHARRCQVGADRIQGG
jgi:hypothetical protein